MAKYKKKPQIERVLTLYGVVQYMHNKRKITANQWIQATKNLRYLHDLIDKNM